MDRAFIKRIGRGAGFLAVPIALATLIGLIALRQFEWYIVVGLILFLVLAAIFAATNPEVWQRSLGRQRVSSTVSGIVVITALAGIMILVNVLMQRTNILFDVTANKNFTVSDSTNAVLQKISQPITATIFYSAASQDAQARAADTLNQYSTRTDKLKVQSVDADRDFLYASRYNLKSDLTTNAAVVFEQGSRREEVGSIDEQSFTTALLKLQTPVSRRVLILTGHQELTVQATQTGNSLDSAVAALTQNGYQVQVYNSATGTALATGRPTAGEQQLPIPVQLNPANDILLIAGPRGRYSDEEKTRIVTFLRQGGKALIAYDISGNIDPLQATNLNELIADFGVRFVRGVVLETNPQRHIQNNNTALAPEIVASSSLNTNLQTVFVLESVSIEKTANSTSEYGEVLRTSDGAYLKTNLATKTGEFEQGDLRGPLVVAATVSQVAKDAASPIVTNTAGVTQTLTTRLVLVGSSSTFSSQLLGGSLDNYNFLINAINFLNESTNQVVITPRNADVKPFTINGSQAAAAFWTSFLGLPLLILFVGLAAWWKRR